MPLLYNNTRVNDNQQRDTLNIRVFSELDFTQLALNNC